MEGQFLIRQIYDDEITYNLIGAAVEILSKSCVFMFWTMKVSLSCTSTCLRCRQCVFNISMTKNSLERDVRTKVGML